MSGLDVTQVRDTAALEDQGQWVDILNEIGEPYDPPVRMLVAGTYSSVYRKVDSAQTERAVKMGRKALRRDVLEKNRLERAAACILQWDGVVGELTRENAMLLMSAPWIREQVEEAMADHAGFSKSA